MVRRALILVMAALAAPAAALEAGSPVPALAAPVLGEARVLSLRELRGRVVYVDFWASWCAPCRISMPALDALYRKHSARGFTVVGVNKDVTVGDAQRYLKRVPVGFPLAHDAQDALARAFDVKAMPSGYLIDRRGVVRHVHRGFTQETAAQLEREIEQLLGEAP